MGNEKTCRRFCINVRSVWNETVVAKISRCGKKEKKESESGNSAANETNRSAGRIKMDYKSGGKSTKIP